MAIRDMTTGEVRQAPVDPLLKAINDLDSDYRCSMHSPKEGPTVFVCELQDRTTKKMWVRAETPEGEKRAMELAVEKARTTRRPLTPAQEADAAFVDSLAQIERLRAELEQLKAEKATPAPDKPKK